MNIRPMTIEDYTPVMQLWGSCEGIGLSDADSLDGISQFLERNPGLSCVALEEDEIVGAVLCGHDGRRGYLHHLAVKGTHRGMGIGKQIVELCLVRLAAAGIAKCHLFVHPDNHAGAAFWTRVGWQKRNDLDIMSMSTGMKGS